MTSTADAAIQALQVSHDKLAARVATYDDAALARPSAATQWSVAQVLSHLGSGAEIMMGTLATTQSEAAEPVHNQTVWDRYNAMQPRQQADHCIAADAALVATLAAMDDASRNALQFDLPFLPQPVGLDVLSALRLAEAALHGWDVAVTDDPDATVEPAAVAVLLDAFAGPLSVLVGFMGSGVTTSAVLAVHTREPDRDLTLQVNEQPALRASAPSHPDGELNLPAEALLRLLAGRLRAEHTPVGSTATGALDLDALRTAFPGY